MGNEALNWHGLIWVYYCTFGPILDIALFNTYKESNFNSANISVICFSLSQISREGSPAYIPLYDINFLYQIRIPYGASTLYNYRSHQNRESQGEFVS